MRTSKNAEEMKIIQEAEARIQEKLRNDFVPEDNKYKDGICFIVSRCIRGSFRGLFMLTQLITTDGRGNWLKKPIRKVLIEGTDRDGINEMIDRAVGKRYFS
jgi:hypothetical protein